MQLTDGVNTLAGIGPKKSDALAAAGIFTIGDLLWDFPRKYEDRNLRGSLSEPSEEAVTVEAIVAKQGTVVRTRKGLSLFVLPVEEITTEGRVIRGEAVWFNQPWLANAFQMDTAYYFYGKVAVKNNRRQIMSPQFAVVGGKDDFFALKPIYGAIEGITSERRSKLIAGVLDSDVEIGDEMPKSLLEQYDLLPISAVLEKSHRPADRADLTAAKRRLKFEEALKINLGILNNRPENRPTRFHIHNFNQLKPFEASLPFALTPGQLSVLSDIISDLKSDRVMNRLVLGDVGSGKTIIAVACSYLFALAGYQSAYMAPTEILAEQHYENFKKFLEPFGIEVVLLTGHLKTAERNGVLEKIASGSARVMIGTHALISEGVDYYNLCLVITDEQHRFGVRQRGKLGLKGERPHTLVMSATPIPRTLALVLYGDLDLSVIDGMPAGRKKIKTYFYGTKALSKIYDFTEKELAKGYQAFVVCPFIEASEEMSEVRDTERVFEEVKNYFAGRYQVGCLHGKMSETEKNAVIDAYTKKEIQILVATSIIEVGIDVPDVSVMIIMSADRFGLSQLHQLRGRAGRGDQQAYCFLVSDLRNDKTIERMKVIVNHNNGLDIAEADYQLRGPGDYFGFRQHGFPDLKALDPYADSDLIAETRQLAETIMNSHKADMITYRAKVLTEFYRAVEISLN